MKRSSTGNVSSIIAYVYIFAAGLFWSVSWFILAGPTGVANLWSVVDLWYAVPGIPGLVLVWFGMRGVLSRRKFESERKWLRITFLTFASLIAVNVLLHIVGLELARLSPPPKP